MKTIGNLLWFFFAGLWIFLCNVVIGVMYCALIFLIPFGIQSFKIAIEALFPFGKEVKLNFDSHPIANTIWIITGGVQKAALTGLIGVLLCITVVGIPFGKQCFKLAKLSLAPFGANLD